MVCMVVCFVYIIVVYVYSIDVFGVSVEECLPIGSCGCEGGWYGV